MELYRVFTEGMMVGETVEAVREFLASVGYADPFEEWQEEDDLFEVYGEIATSDYYAPLRFVFSFDDGVVECSYFEECEE